jgi:small-conductance mechanosensitive channel
VSVIRRILRGVLGVALIIAFGGMSWVLAQPIPNELVAPSIQISPQAFTPEGGISPNISPTPQQTASPAFFQPTPQPTRPSLVQLQNQGSPILIGNIPIVKLQTADYSSDVRAQAVGSVIEKFLSFDMNGNIPEPEVQAILDSNQQYVLMLGEKKSFEETKRYLLTVTYADAGAARGTFTPTLDDVKTIALSWADQLEKAIADYRIVKLDQIRGRDPVIILQSSVIALAYLGAGYFCWRFVKRFLPLLHTLLEQRLGISWSYWVSILMTLTRFLCITIIVLSSLHIAISSLPMLRPLQRVIYAYLRQGLIFTISFLGDILSQPLGNSTISLESLIIFAGSMVVVFIISHHISLGLQERFLSRIGLDLGTQEASSTIFKYGLTLLGMLIVLPISGLNLGSFTVIAGSLALGVGLGMQNIFNDYVSYIAILLERPIQVGDFVEIDSVIGTVERIHPWATIVRTLDRVFVIVPNSRFTNGNVINWSYRDPRCRVHVPITVAHGSDTTKVREALLYVAKQNSRVLSIPEPQVWLTSLGPSALQFELLVWVNRPQDQFLLQSELNYAIDNEFRRQNIIIPFPQQDLHIRSADGLYDLFQKKAHTDSNGKSSYNVQGRIILPQDTPLHSLSEDEDDLDPHLESPLEDG